MNVLVSNTCNRRCSYCFAAERVSYTTRQQSEARAAPPFISEDDFERAVEFACRNRVRKFGILGGEPSTHPRFVSLLERALAGGLDVKVFTNGMWRPRDIEAVAGFGGDARRRLTLVTNLNQPDETPDHERRRQERFLEELGRCALPSFNIYRLGFDPLFLVDTIERHAMRRHIRLGVAQPLAEHDSEFIAVEDYPRLAPTLMALAEACDSRDITIGFDCGFTLCMFTPEQIGRLQLAGCRFKASCGPAVDVGTDLSVWACFPLSTFARGAALDDFGSLAEIVDHFAEEYDRLYWTGVLPQCIDCRHRRRRQCPGGCAAHVYRSFNPCE